MIKTFTPKMEILPPAQQRLWPELSSALKIARMPLAIFP